MSWEPAPGVMLGGKYRLERALASGGMGSVWIARHTRLDADVAVKLMSRQIGQDPSSVARFEREAKACAQLSSPHVVGVHDFGVEDGTPYMVMELLRGEDLGTRIDRVGRVSIAEAAGVAVAIGRALRVAHDAGLIHRDLKPRNIFIARQGDEEVVKLVDFGIARETKTCLVEDKTTTGVVMGSPFHMSPEQALAHDVDHRSDLWSLGVVLYRLITGARPFEAESLTSVLLTICTTPHRLPSVVHADLPPAVDVFFAKALAKDPAKRFQNAREMTDAFLALTGRSLGDSSRHVPYVPAAAPSSPSMPMAPISADAANASTPSGSGAASFDGQTPAPPLNDASASLALRAVSTGPVPRATSPGSRRGLGMVAAAVIACVAVVGLLFVRSRGTTGASSDTPRSPSVPAVTEPTAPATQQPAVAPEPSVSAAPTSAASSSAAASAASVAPSATPAAPAPLRGTRRPSPAADAPVAQPAGPAIDPFTGLPVAR